MDVGEDGGRITFIWNATTRHVALYLDSRDPKYINRFFLSENCRPVVTKM
jgi:hypothetical protein